MKSTIRVQSLWMVGASIAFTGMSACIKLAAGSGVPSSHIIFYRGLFSVLIMSAILRARRRPLHTPHWRVHLRRGAAGCAGLIAYVVALTLLPLGTAIALNYTSPMLLGIMLLYVQRERPQISQVASLAGGLSGIVLLLHPTYEHPYWLGELAALASAFLAAWSALNIRALGRLNEDPARTVLYFSLFITVATLPWYLFSAPGKVTLVGFVFVTVAALWATVGQIMLTLAYQRGHALVVSLLGYSQVVFTSVLGILIWHDRLTLPAWLGMALIVVSGILATSFLQVAKPTV